MTAVKNNRYKFIHRFEFDDLNRLKGTWMTEKKFVLNRYYHLTISFLIAGLRLWNIVNLRFKVFCVEILWNISDRYAQEGDTSYYDCCDMLLLVRKCCLMDCTWKGLTLLDLEWEMQSGQSWLKKNVLWELDKFVANVVGHDAYSVFIPV